MNKITNLTKGETNIKNVTFDCAYCDYTCMQLLSMREVSSQLEQRQTVKLNCEKKLCNIVNGTSAQPILKQYSSNV